MASRRAWCLRVLLGLAFLHVVVWRRLLARVARRRTAHVWLSCDAADARVGTAEGSDATTRRDAIPDR